MNLPIRRRGSKILRRLPTGSLLTTFLPDCGSSAATLHFVPTSCSWLSLVERFFAQITTRRTRRGSFESVKELQDEIKHYLKLHNQDPKPFKWTASAEAIIEKVAKCRAISETLH